MPVRRGLQATTMLLVLALVAHGGPVRAASAAFSGTQAGARSLEEALQTLQSAGLNLVYSNALVKSDYRTEADADAAAPLHEQAAALLAPFGLELEQAGSDLWYVVRAAEPARPPPAEDAAPQPRLIEEVLVSSSRYRLIRKRHERRRLDARELEVVPSIGRDLLRAVNQLPGQASVGISARSHMRGGNTNEVLYLVDGVQLIEPFHMGDFHALFSTISPSLVDSINVYHAGFPAAYGSRLSGVVDMELTQPSEPLEGRLNIGFVDVSTQAQGEAGDTQWLLSARRSTVDYLLDYVEQDYGRPTFHDEVMRLSWKGEDSEVTVGVLYGNDQMTLEDNSARELARADYHNLATWVRAVQTYSDDLELEVTGSFTAIDNERQGDLNDLVDAVGSLQETREFTVASFRAAMRWRASEAWLMHGGLEGQQQAAEFDVDISTRYGVLGRPLQPADMLMRTVTADRNGRLLTAFLSAQNRLTDAVTVELGWRYDVQDIDPVHDEQFSPRIQISYDDGEAWRGFLNVGRYAQHQNLYELQLDDGLLELNDPQLADQVSVGTDWTANPRWRLRLEAYWRQVDDPWSRFENLYNRWVLLPELHADRVRLAPDEARTYGGEVLVHYEPRQTLQWSLSLAVARAEERLEGEWRPRPWEQRRTWRAGMDWRPGNWRVGVSAAYHTGWPTTSLISQPMSSLERLYDARLPGYFSLDLHAARRFDLQRSLLEVYFDLSNATFAENVGGYRYQLDGGALVRDSRLLLPPVPVLGLSWSW